MANVAVRVAVHRPGPGRLELREGGGWVAVLGLPFLGGGFFLGLGAAGLVHFQGSDRTHDAWMLPLGALLFSAVGVWLVLGRAWTYVDARRRTLTRRFGLLVPMSLGTRVHRLDEFAAVRVEYAPGDSASADRYRVELVRRAPARALRACSSTRYATARAAAEALAETAELPLEDASTAHASVTAPGDLRRGLAAVPDDGPVPTPAVLRTVVEPTAPGGVRLRVPRRASLVPVATPFLLVATLLAFLARSPHASRAAELPTIVAIVVLAVVLFGLVGLPLYRALGWTRVLADATGLEVRERGRTTRIAARDVLDVDCSSGDERLAIPTVRGTRPPARPARLPGWLAPLLSRGVQVKHRGGIITFGEGLPADELAWLRATLRRALRGGAMC